MRLAMRFLLVSAMFAITSCASLSSKNHDDSPEARLAKINAQLGIAYLEQQQITRAKNKLLLALRQDPSIPEPWYSMAYFLETTGNTEQADVYYQKAVDISRGRGDAENNYGTFLCRTGKYADAIKHFVVAAKDSEYLTPADAYENAGLCASRIAGDNHADEFFRKAVANDPQRPVSWMGLAELHFKKGDYKAAQKELKQFLILSPPTERSMALNAKLSQKLKIVA